MGLGERLERTPAVTSSALVMAGRRLSLAGQRDRQCALRQDAAAIMERVDLPALRRSLDRQMCSPISGKIRRIRNPVSRDTHDIGISSHHICYFDP